MSVYHTLYDCKKKHRHFVHFYFLVTFINGVTKHDSHDLIYAPLLNTACIFLHYKTKKEAYNQTYTIMETFCTSCGQSISSSSKFYKCRECAHHLLCKTCSKLERNVAIFQFHTFDKMSRTNKTSVELVEASARVTDKEQKVRFFLVFTN